jgi:glycosyltransferase involved in cell wall biosynthesis
VTTAPAPRVSLIVPSWTGEIARLRASIERQTFRDYEIEVVTGVSPAARARNVGAARARGAILLFIDDDAYFGHPGVMQQLVDVLDRDPMVAVAGSSKLAPRSATRLQRAIARQVPRTVYPVQPEDMESNPPTDRYGFTAITTTCCAVRRDVYEQAGGFDERLTTGPEDTDFFYRVRRLGYRLVIAGRCWVYHDPPGGMRDLVRKSFWYGVGHALEARKNPERRMALLPLDRWYGKLVPLLAVIGFPAALFVHYYFDPVRKLVIDFRPLKTISTYAVLWGYVYGWFHGPPKAAATTYRGRKAASSDEPRPARVLYVDAYPKIGGGQQVLMSMVTRLDRRRYEPLVALPASNPLRARLDAAGVRSVALPFDERNYILPDWRRPDTVLASIFSVARAIRAIMALARREDVALIHANSVVAGAHALPAALLLGVPCVVHAHDFLTAALTDHAVTLLARSPRAAMIFVSQALADYYGAAGGRFRYRVIHNGVDPAVFRPDPVGRARLRAEWGLPADSFLFGAVGRIEPGKGFGRLIEAFAPVAARYPQARLVIVGEVGFNQASDIKRNLLKRVAHLRLEDRVVLAGFRADMPAVMAALDALVHCPLAPEGFGLILIEAMACGCPVIACPVGGMAEVVRDGQTGLLIPQGEASAITAAMTRLIGEPALASRLATAGRRAAEEEFSVSIQASAVADLYADLLGAAAPAAAGPAPTPAPAEAAGGA